MRQRGKKILFNEKDTWSMYETLNPIIASGLKRFKEVIETDEFAGVPNTFLATRRSQLALTAPADIYSDEEIGIHFTAWLACIDEMIYAFEDKSPDILTHSFRNRLVKVEEAEGDFQRFTIERDNEVERERYHEDEKAHDKRVQEGLELFAKYYKNLWW